MKKKVFLVSILMVLMLTGCGAKFEISGSDLQDYAVANEGQYADVSDQFGYDYLDNCYVMEVGNTHIELWDMDNTNTAYSWYEAMSEKLKADAKMSTGSNTSKSGDYTVTSRDDIAYRILFSEDKCIYAEGYYKDEINTILSGLGVIKD